MAKGLLRTQHFGQKLRWITEDAVVFISYGAFFIIIIQWIPFGGRIAAGRRELCVSGKRPCSVTYSGRHPPYIVVRVLWRLAVRATTFSFFECIGSTGGIVMGCPPRVVEL